MRAAASSPFAALLLLLVGLGGALVGASTTRVLPIMADEDRAGAHPSGLPGEKEYKLPPTHLRAHNPHDGPAPHGRGPIMTAPKVGGKQDVTGANDAHLSEVSQFASDHLRGQNSRLTYVQVKAEVQVVAGMIYTLYYQGNNPKGECEEERVLVVYDKPWMHERTLKSDTVTQCAT